MYNIFFETGWDSGIQVIPAAKIIARNGDKSFLSDIYFSNYPNNLLLVSLYAAVLKINDSVGIFFENYCLMAIVILNCAISTSSAVLIYKTGKKLLNEKYAFLGYLLGVCMLVLSPWNVICYSDPLALFFPVFICPPYNYTVFLHKSARKISHCPLKCATALSPSFSGLINSKTGRLPLT